MPIQPKPAGGIPKLPYRDDPAVPETFVDSFKMAIFDGAVMRMELTVQRFDEPRPPGVPTGYAKTAARLVIPGQFIPDLYNQLGKVIAVMAEQGQVTVEDVPAAPASPKQ